MAGVINTEWPGLPILMVTGYAELPPAAGAALLQLTKPFSLDDLAGAVARLGAKSGA